MESLKPPKELDMESHNLAETWKEWQESWELYEISSGLDYCEDKVRVATLLCLIGVKARRVINTLPGVPTNNDERTTTMILEAVRDYCTPRANLYEV